jgi:hypothetical protein
MPKHNYQTESAEAFITGAEERANRHAVKSEDLVQIGNRVPKELRQRLKRVAVNRETSINAILIEALENWLKQAEGQEQNRSTAFEDDGL